MIPRSLVVGLLVQTNINVAKELWISTRAFLVITPDSIASVFAFENRVGRVKFFNQLFSGSQNLIIYYYYYYEALQYINILWWHVSNDDDTE